MGLVAIGLLMAEAAQAAPDTIIGSAAVLPGNTVNIPVTFTNNGTVSGIQIDIQYNPSQITAGEPVLDTLLNAGYRVSSFEYTLGSRQLVIIPPASNPALKNGDVVQLPFTMGLSATVLTSVPLQVSQIIMSDANAALVSSTSILNGLIIHAGNRTSDTDNDGMKDYYEIIHGLHPTDSNDAGLDPDLDGLTNLQEFLANTDPHNKDTDGDGIDDGYEVRNGLNPLVNDAALDLDGDGVSNLDEFVNGTDASGASETPLQNFAAKSGNKELTLSWDNAHGVVTYNIYWSLTPGVTKATGTKISNVTNPYTHTGLKNGTSYYYVVTAENTYGESPESVELKAIPEGFPVFVPIVGKQGKIYILEVR